METLKVEVGKLLKRKSSISSIVLFFAIPIIFIILIKTKNSAVVISGKINEFTLTLTVWEMLRILKISYLIPILLTTSNLGKEISDRSIHMYLIRVSRKKLFFSKLFSNILLTTMLYLSFWSSSLLVSHFLLSGTEFFEKNSHNLHMLSYAFLLGLLEILFVTVLACTISIFFTNIGGGVLTFLVIILFTILSNIKIIMIYLPTYICDFTRILKLATNQDITNDAVKSTLTLFIYTCAVLILGSVAFKNMDLN
ncbi:hypothetical protein [Enterococcus rivorum]|uniref:Uncharacterized protein n=1 Tax=Enterococcus rivorum TaxID=762845 RepID=A0A1E5KU06_9ENTE|nr:hypothetical protein [Enterococcus rivorum]MBP2098426.1 ABC-type transport system involved in multi-copper enzyme maturation permease subunit [Enterococcus rivorum]OEH81364.1 hypothetical protein BCR26_16770 [Enterococcus rivorum]